MKIVVQKITPPTHVGYETPLYLIRQFDPELYENHVVQGRHHITLTNVCKIEGEYQILDRDHPAVLIDLKDDATGEKPSRITLVFDPDVAKEIYVPR